jgi:DNA (cytosine-5)-methyltransferase 1
MGYIAEGFEFPSVQDLTLKLKDLLEPKVDEKYYLSEMVQSRFVYKPKGENVIGTTAPDFRTIGERDKVYHTDGVMGTLMATDYKQPKQIIVAGSLNHYGNDQMNRVHDIEGISPTITVPSGGGRQQKILIKNATKQGYLEAHDGDCIDLTYPESKTKRGRVRPQESHTITTKNEYGVISENPFRIRKLTPLETWRLMAFSDSDFKKAKTSGMSDTQLYKQAGNSIVVTVLEAIFTQMFKGR